MLERRRLWSALLTAFLLASPAAAEEPPRYRNFELAIYCRVDDVRRMAEGDWLERSYAALAKDLKIGKVYLETHRSRVTNDRETMLKVKRFFESRGIETAGGITLVADEGFEFKQFSYTSPADRKHVEGVVRFTAGLFDELILDDFFFTTTKTESDILAKGTRSWSEFVFELLNEPFGKLTPELWNDYLKEGLAVVRATNPTRAVIVGGGRWNSIDGLQGLVLPENDRNLIATVHYYTPMEFTHQGAPWADEHKDRSGVLWTGTDQERRRIELDFARAQQWAVAHDRPVHLGEFGAYDKADMDSRARYTAAVARAAERLGWSWAYWQFDSDFVVYDVEKDAWVEPLRKALVP